MLEFEEFAYSNMQVGEAGRADVNEQAYEAASAGIITAGSFHGRSLSWPDG